MSEVMGETVFAPWNPRCTSRAKNGTSRPSECFLWHPRLLVANALVGVALKRDVQRGRTDIKGSRPSRGEDHKIQGLIHCAPAHDLGPTPLDGASATVSSGHSPAHLAARRVMLRLGTAGIEDIKNRATMGARWTGRLFNALIAGRACD